MSDDLAAMIQRSSHQRGVVRLHEAPAGRVGRGQQLLAQSENAEVVIEQIETFATDWIKGNKEAKEQAINTYSRFWPRVEAVRKEKVRRMEHMKRGDELPSGVLEMVATRRKIGSQHWNKRVKKLIGVLQITQIPYKGSAPALLDVMSGRLQVAMPTLPTALAQIKAGRARVVD